MPMWDSSVRWIAFGWDWFSLQQGSPWASRYPEGVPYAPGRVTQKKRSGGSSAPFFVPGVISAAA